MERPACFGFERASPFQRQSGAGRSPPPRCGPAGSTGPGRKVREGPAPALARGRNREFPTWPTRQRRLPVEAGGSDCQENWFCIVPAIPGNGLSLWVRNTDDPAPVAKQQEDVRPAAPLRLAAHRFRSAGWPGRKRQQRRLIRAALFIHRSERTRQIAKSSGDLPAARPSLNHCGWRPRPDQVRAAFSGWRYLAGEAGLLPFLPPTRSESL